MRFTALVTALGLAFACGTHDDPKPKDHVVQLQVVDDGSPYMKQLFDQVASDRDTSIRSEMDRWRPESGVTHTDYYLSAQDPKVIERYIAEHPALAVPADRQLVFERFDNGRWRTYLVFRHVELDRAAIASAKQADDPNTHRPIVLVDFTKDGAGRFAELTRRVQGHKLATIVDGIVVSAPIVNSPIEGGHASISLEDASQVAELVSSLNAKK